MKNEKKQQFIKNYEACIFYDHHTGIASPMTAEDIVKLPSPFEVTKNMKDEKILFAYGGEEMIKSWTVMELAEELGETVEIID